MKAKPRKKRPILGGQWSTAENDLAVKLASSLRNKWFRDLDDLGYGKPNLNRNNVDEVEVYDAIQAEVGILVAGWIERCLIAENIKELEQQKAS